MKLFSNLYKALLRWSAHRYAPYYLAAVSFFEAVIFPIPPDVMLVSMGLAKLKTPQKIWQYALITTISSVLGAVLGYVLGAWFFQWIEPYFMKMGYMPDYEYVRDLFKTWGFWAIFIAGFTPIPYKVFTITAGAVQMALFPFIAASLLGRGARFFLVALMVYCFGESCDRILKKHLDKVSLLIIAILIIAYFLLSACGHSSSQAPKVVLVVNAEPINLNLNAKIYRVRVGDNLYAVAFQYEKDVKALARINHLSEPYVLKINQIINLKTIQKPVQKPVVPQTHWRWPIKGKIIKKFDLSKGQKGLDIKTVYAGPVRATKKGQVVYSGSGLQHYGKLIIIKHKNGYLSAYGYNSQLFVKEGQSVEVGQKIAAVGHNSKGQSVLHFEIRKVGKPVNPIKYLK